MEKMILFDFDGVIVDSFEAAYEMIEEFGLGFDREYYRNMFMGNIYDSVDEHHRNDNNKKVNQDEWFDLYAKKLLVLPVVPGMIAALESLSKTHTLAVISSSVTSPIHSYLELHNIHHFFEKVYGADVHKSKVEKIKMVFAEFGVTAKNCIFITDTAGDLKEAAKMGIESIVVTWGFHGKEKFEGLKVRDFVDSPADLAKAVDRYFSK